jgi:hypothetical protein
LRFVKSSSVRPRKGTQPKVCLVLDGSRKDPLCLLASLKPSCHMIYLAFLLPHFLECRCLALVYHVPKPTCPNGLACSEGIVIHTWTWHIRLIRLHPCASKESDSLRRLLLSAPAPLNHGGWTVPVVCMFTAQTLLLIGETTCK